MNDPIIICFREKIWITRKWKFWEKRCLTGYFPDRASTRVFKVKDNDKKRLSCNLHIPSRNPSQSGTHGSFRRALHGPLLPSSRPPIAEHALDTTGILREWSALQQHSSAGGANAANDMRGEPESGIWVDENPNTKSGVGMSLHDQNGARIGSPLQTLPGAPSAGSRSGSGSLPPVESLDTPNNSPAGAPCRGNDRYRGVSERIRSVGRHFSPNVFSPRRRPMNPARNHKGSSPNSSPPTRYAEAVRNALVNHTQLGRMLSSMRSSYPSTPPNRHATEPGHNATNSFSSDSNNELRSFINVSDTPDRSQSMSSERQLSPVPSRQRAAYPDDTGVPAVAPHQDNGRRDSRLPGHSPLHDWVALKRQVQEMGVITIEGHIELRDDTELR